MHQSVAMVRAGLHTVPRRLAVEALVLGLAIVLAPMVLSNVSRPLAAGRQGEQGQAGVAARRAADATIKASSERFALSSVSTGRRTAPPPPTVAEAGPAEAENAAPHATIASPPPRQGAPARDKPRAHPLHAASRVAAFPPPRPLAETVAVAAPAPASGLPPIQHVMRLAADLWDSAPGAGALVVDNVVSVGGQLGSIAKKLM